MSKSKVLKKRKSISNEKYPVAVSWEVEEREDLYGKLYNTGTFSCFLFGEEKCLNIYAYDKDVKAVNCLIKELTDFRNTMLKGK